MSGNGFLELPDKCALIAFEMELCFTEITIKINFVHTLKGLCRQNLKVRNYYTDFIKFEAMVGSSNALEKSHRIFSLQNNEEFGSDRERGTI